MLDLFWGRGTLDRTHISTIYLFKIMKIIGFNPPLPPKRWYSFYSIFAKFLLCIVIPVIFNLGYIVDSANLSITQILTAIQAGINIACIPPKLLAILHNRTNFTRAEMLMAKLDGRCKNPAESAIIRKAAITGNRFVVMFFTIYTIYGNTTFITSIVMGSPPFQLYLPFLNWKESRSDFWQQVLIELLLFQFLLLAEVLNDSYPVIYIYTVRSHTQILTERVRTLGADPDKSQETNYRDLVQCIIDHKLLLELHDTIAPIISITIFVQFLITAIMLGCTMINIFIFANTSAQVACCIYLFTVMVQIFPCCLHATLLMEDGELLTLAIFHCNWMYQEKRFRKMLLFFLHRTQKPMTLTALKLFPINLRTSLSIAKFSFSLYTLIKNMDFGKI